MPRKVSSDEGHSKGGFRLIVCNQRHYNGTVCLSACHHVRRSQL